MYDIDQELCREVLTLDKSIRFAALVNDLGDIVASEYRAGQVPLLTKEKSELSAAQSILRMGSRRALEVFLGKTIYAFALYEKIRRAVIPLNGNFIFMVSFDVDSEHEPIILQKIIPLLKKSGLLD